MGDVSENFSRHEFACRCGCGCGAVDVELLQYLQQLRTELSAPVRINSGCRCFTHNIYVGGEPHSYHMGGMAADVAVAGVEPDDVYKVLDQILPSSSCGLKAYPRWVHVDVRPDPWRHP